MEYLDVKLPFLIHECWFRIINSDLITFETTLSKEEVPTKLLTSYKLKGPDYSKLVETKSKILTRLNKYQLQTKKDFFGNCEQLFEEDRKRPSTADEIKAALSYNVRVLYDGYINRYKEWECEAYNPYYPKYNEMNRFNYLWEEDFNITPDEIEQFLTTLTKMHLDLDAQYKIDQDEYNEQLRIKQLRY